MSPGDLVLARRARDLYAGERISFGLLAVVIAATHAPACLCGACASDEGLLLVRYRPLGYRGPDGYATEPYDPANWHVCGHAYWDTDQEGDHGLRFYLECGHKVA